MLAVDENRIQHCTDNARVTLRSDAHAGRKTRIDGELSGVFAGDQQPALLNKFLQMSQSVITQAGTNVRGAVDGSKVWSQLRFLPRHRIIPQRNAVENFKRRGMTHRSKDNDIVFCAQVRLFGCGLRADVIEGHARVIESIAPPTFGLRAEPGVHERNARSRDRMDRHRRRCAESRCIERQVVQNLAHAVIRSIRDEQRAGREMFAVSVERFIRDLNGRTFQFVDQGQERNLPRVRHREHTARARDLAGESRRIVKRRHLRLENRGIDNAHNLHIEEMRE